MLLEKIALHYSLHHKTTVQTSKVKVSHTYKELIKETAIKVITKKSEINRSDHKKKEKQIRHIIYVSEIL